MPKKNAVAQIESTSAEPKKKTYRTVEERQAAIDKKIESHKQSIAALEAERAKIGAPRARKTSLKSVLARMKELKLSPEEILQKLEQ